MHSPSTDIDPHVHRDVHTDIQGGDQKATVPDAQPGDPRSDQQVLDAAPDDTFPASDPVSPSADLPAEERPHPTQRIAVDRGLKAGSEALSPPDPARRATGAAGGAAPSMLVSGVVGGLTGIALVLLGGGHVLRRVVSGAVLGAAWAKATSPSKQ